VGDLNRLKTLGLVDNVTLFPHGLIDRAFPHAINQDVEIPLIASYGFCLPNKGISELIEAARILKVNGNPVRLLLLNAEFPDPISSRQIEKIRGEIFQKGMSEYVNFRNDFLTDEESLQELSAADLIIFPYQSTGESSSAAVRSGLSSKRPVAVTPISIFDDLRGSVFRLQGIKPQEIAKSIQAILQSLSVNSEEAKEIATTADRWRFENDFSNVGKRLHAMLQTLLSDT
jgi:hypothetical protein